MKENNNFSISYTYAILIVYDDLNTASSSSIQSYLPEKERRKEGGREERKKGWREGGRKGSEEEAD